MKRLLWILALLPLTALAQQQKIYCVAGSSTACNTTSNPGNGSQGDPAWKAFGKVNADFTQLYGMFGSSTNLKSTGTANATDIIGLWSGVPSSTLCLGSQGSLVSCNGGTGGGGTPGGSSNDIQFNSAGVFGGLTVGAGETIQGNSGAPTATSTLTLGASGTLGSITFGNGTSGLLTLQPTAGALGSITASLPANTGTLAELNLAQTWTAGQTFQNAITSTVATGTAPFTVASTTNVANLNASSLNGATFASPGSIGSSSPGSGAFTTLSASGTVSGTGFSTYLASPPAIGGSAPAAGSFTTLSSTGTYTNSKAGAASAAAETLTGAPYTAGTSTTNFPLFYLNDGTGPTTFNANGTELGENAPSGFTGNLLDFHINGGSSVAKLDYLGNLTVTSCSGCGTTSIQTNAVANTSQAVLNLESTNNISVSNPSGGNVTISQTQPINAQAGTTYTISCTSDAGNLVTLNNSASVAVSLPQATGSCGAGFAVTVEDLGTGTATITPTTSTINGATSLTVAQNRGCSIVSDGTNYQVGGCTALVSGTGGSPGGSTYAVQYNAGSSTFGGLSVGAGQILQGSAAAPTATSTPTLGAAGTLGSVTMGNATSGLLTLEPTTGALGTVTASLPANTGTIAELNLAQSWSAVQTFTNSDIRLLGSSTGYTIFTSANASSTNYTATLPAATDTIAEIAATQTLTNKTISGSSNTLSAIALSSLATQSADTIVANATGSTAAPTAVSIGSFNMALLQASTKFTITATGCTPSATTGGATAGTITLAAGPCTSIVITMNGATGLTAANGWHCNVGDKTLQAAGTWFGEWPENSSTATTATIAIPSAAGATDVISFDCTGY